VRQNAQRIAEGVNNARPASTKEQNVTILHLKQSISRSPSRLALLLFPLVVAGSLLLWGAGAEAIAATYTTNFPLTENPISEGGHWINGLTNGNYWSDVATTPGNAFGTQTGIGPNFADSTALLTGSWGPTQTVEATVFIAATNTTSFQEVELRLRSSLSAHICTGYEVLFSVDPANRYCQIVRWNGPLGSFTLLDARAIGVHNGDVVKATIVGSTITCYINGAVIFGVTDSTYSSGSPGIGFYLQGGSATASNYGFSSLTVSDGTQTPTPTPTGPPFATTNPATNIASFSATINGSLNPQGLTTTVYFQYGTTTSYGRTTPVQTQTGNTVRNVSANISNLSANTVYHFRIVATNINGTRFGSDRTFRTLSATGPPVVTTNPATLVTGFSARLNGSLDPHGLTTSVYFRYGTTTSYGLTTAPQSQSGNTYRNVSANISNLSANTVYHFRTVATNINGTRFGSERTFRTP
jgi:hypothetical protein